MYISSGLKKCIHTCPRGGEPDNEVGQQYNLDPEEL